MVLPLTKQEQLTDTHFIPKHIIAILFAQTKFDAVEMDDPKTGEPRQVMGDIGQSERDCLDMKEFLLKFGVLEENIHLQINPSEADTKKLYMTVLKKIMMGRKKSPQEDFLVIHTFAGHGVQESGTQYLLHNEWCKNRGYYKMFAAEEKLRVMAKSLKNSYHIGIFACCRERYEKKEGYYPKGTKDEKNNTVSASVTVKSELDIALEKEIEATRSSEAGMRGNTAASDVSRENLMLLFGCRPSLGVLSETTMIRDLIKTLTARVDRRNLSLTIPAAVDQMTGNDASFEMVASNSIMPMKLFFEDNITTHKAGLIFVTEYTSQNEKKLSWSNAVAKGQRAEKLLKEGFGFDDVTVVNNASKEEMITAFNNLQAKVNSFSETKKGQEVMLTSVFWIGHAWYQNGHHRQYKLKQSDAAPAKTEDGTVCPKTFGVTKDGEFLQIYEYCSRLVNADKDVHCLYVLDWFSLHLGQLNQDWVKKDQPWFELQLTHHRGWSRFSCVNTGVAELADHFMKCKQQGQAVFQFPFHLTEAGIDATAWKSVPVPEQVIIDVRSDKTKAITRACEPTATFKRKYEVYETRPMTESAHEVSSMGIWNQTVDDLQDQNQILHVCKANNSTDVDFIFHEADDVGNDGELDELERITINRKHFRFQVIAKNYTGKPIKNKLISVFFANGCHATPSQTVIFTRPDEKSPWGKEPAIYPLNSAENCSEVFRNAFIIPNKTHGTCLLVFRDEHAIVFNDKMEQISIVNYKKERINNLIQNYTTAPDFNSLTKNGSTWMMTFQTGAPKAKLCDNVHVGSGMQNTWCMRWKLQESDCSVTPVDSKKEAIWFQTEAIQGLVEYAPNKLCFYARQAHLFIVEDWKVMKKIDDPDGKNINKYSFQIFPGFDLKTFPFIVSSGESSFNIINVSTGHMEVLVDAATSALHAQTAAFFRTDKLGQVTMHFPTTKTTEENLTRQSWHIMKFKEDFIKTLKTYGRLPFKDPEEALKMYLENQKLKQMLGK